MCDEVGRPRPPAAEADRVANGAHEYVRNTSTSARHGSSNDFKISTDGVSRCTSPQVISTTTWSGTAVGIDDSERPIQWAGECELRGALVRRLSGERFEDSVLRAFDEVDALL